MLLLCLFAAAILLYAVVKWLSWRMFASPPLVVSECTLVVVDVQKNYGVSAAAIETLVRRQVQLAVRLNWNIIFLEYKGDGPTLPPITAVVQKCNYPRYKIVRKKGYDGSAEVVKACYRCGYGTKYIRVCGLMSGYCVKETVRGLSSKLPQSQIEVVPRSCFPQPHAFNWATDFPQLPNVRIKPVSRVIKVDDQQSEPALPVPDPVAAENAAAETGVSLSA